MDSPIPLSYDASMIRSSVRSFWWRLVGPGYVVVFSLLSVMAVVLVSLNDHSWFVGLLGGVLLFGFAIPVAGFLTHYKRSLSRLEKMAPPQASLTLSEDELSMATSMGASSVSWSAITEIWRHERFWLVFISRTRFITLPLACVPEAAQTFVLEHVKTAGGKIV
jgi:YcxB-like protein